MAVLTITDQELSSTLEQHEYVMIKYFAGWCGSCRLFAPKYKRISENPDFNHVVFLEIDAEANPEARKLAGVDNLPFFAVFKKGVFVQGGAAAKEEFVMELLHALK
jgi:thiol-disulfide isomerase/thioredoxin